MFKWNRRRELRARWREVSKTEGARLCYPLRGCEGAVSNEKLLELILELNALVNLELISHDNPYDNVPNGGIFAHTP